MSARSHPEINRPLSYMLWPATGASISAWTVEDTIAESDIVISKYSSAMFEKSAGKIVEF